MTIPAPAPPIVLVVGGRADLLRACQRAAVRLPALVLDCPIDSIWLAAYAWSPFAIVLTAEAYAFDPKAARDAADATGAKLVRLPRGRTEDAYLEAILRMALDDDRPTIPAPEPLGIAS